jgi:large subunit ribosomal protein L18
MAKTIGRLARQRRHVRVRKEINGTTERPRLCVFRSLNYIYAQVIDDTVGQTLASASDLDAEIKETIKGKKKVESAALVGSLAAKRALDKGVKKVVFDRGGYQYQGRVKSLADAARKAGLEF